MPGSGTRQQGINLLPHRGSWHNTLLNAAATLLVDCVFSVRPCSGFTSTQCSFEQREDLDALTLQHGCLPINNPHSVRFVYKTCVIIKKMPRYLHWIHGPHSTGFAIELKVEATFEGKKEKTRPVTLHHIFFNAKLLHKYTKHQQQPR